MRRKTNGLSNLSVHFQYLECKDDELNELHDLLDSNHKAVTKWKTDLVAKAKVILCFIYSLFYFNQYLKCGN